MTMGTTDIPILPGLASPAERYDGFILDLWGVLHDGERPYPGAVACLDRLRAAGKRACLLSNAPRRTGGVVDKLSRMGITPDHYDHLMTSGEATFEALRDPPDDWHAALGRHCLHIGPARDTDIFDTLERITIVDRPEAADFVLNTGIDDFSETLDDYEPILRASLARRLPMICANPDLVVMVGTDRVVCAGLLAQRYEELGGNVRYHGKPFPSVYLRCFDRLGLTDRRRILAVGDSLRTDVAGANAAGIDVALVTGGIHQEELGTAWGEHPDPARLTAIAAASGHSPTFALPHFTW